jgi:hypothetical protein
MKCCVAFCVTVKILKIAQIPRCLKCFCLQFNHRTKVMGVYDHFEGKYYFCYKFLPIVW